MKNLMLCMFVVLMVVIPAQAAVISVSFYSDKVDTILASEDQAGVIPVENWNNIGCLGITSLTQKHI